MSFSVDKYLGRKFSLYNYNCWDFIREIWLELKGVDIGQRTPEHPTIAERQKCFDEQEKEFIKLSEPKSPCIALLTRAKAVPHVGIYYKGKILHLPESGSRYQRISDVMLTFDKIRFYTC